MKGQKFISAAQKMAAEKKTPFLVQLKQIFWSFLF
jgi:hypothetical protein